MSYWCFSSRRENEHWHVDRCSFQSLHKKLLQVSSVTGSFLPAEFSAIGCWQVFIQGGKPNAEEPACRRRMPKSSCTLLTIDESHLRSCRVFFASQAALKIRRCRWFDNQLGSPQEAWIEKQGLDAWQNPTGCLEIRFLSLTRLMESNI
jgi:hypothetical protein